MDKAPIATIQASIDALLHEWGGMVRPHLTDKEFKTYEPLAYAYYVVDGSMHPERVMKLLQDERARERRGWTPEEIAKRESILIALDAACKRMLKIVGREINGGAA